MTHRIIHGDCIETMLAAKPESVHAVICDPPYAIDFMGKDWDNAQMLGQATGVSGGFQRIPAGTPRPDIAKSDPLMFQAWCTAWGEAAMRVLSPGGYLLAFGAPRTAHRLVAGLEDAGYEVRDTLMWMYGDGMPKGRDLTVAIDKLVGAERVQLGRAAGVGSSNTQSLGEYRSSYEKTGPGSPEAQRWAGFQTCLKPMHEPIALLQKPLARGTTPTGRVSARPMTVAQNLLAHGVGALNLGACAIPGDGPAPDRALEPSRGNVYADSSKDFHVQPGQRSAPTRMPGNVILDPAAAETLDAEAHRSKKPSRFFFCPKVKPKERHAGLELIGNGLNGHPTLKPIALMEWLCTLACPPGGVILDPFMGSGSTGIAALLGGFTFIGIERKREYVDVARARIAHWAPESRGQLVVRERTEQQAAADPFADCRDRCRLVGLGACACAGSQSTVNEPEGVLA